MLIEVRNVTKFFEKGGKTIRALDRVSFSADRPQVIGLIGLNGAGKTTLINTIAGILIPDRGTVRIKGIETWKHPARLISYPFVPYQDPRMHVGEAVTVLKLFYGKGQWDYFEETLGLKEEWNTEIQRLSSGWSARLKVLAAMGQEKPVVLLDEITNKLDVSTADVILNAIREKGKRSVVIFSSHIFSHVEKVADRIIIIHGGRILADGPKDELLGKESLEHVFRRYINGS